MTAQSVRVLAIAFVVCLSAACGAQPTSQTPETVHTAWVTALRDNDRATLLKLAADGDSQTAMVDTALQRMQESVQHGYVAGGVEGGAFQGVDVLALEDAGQGKVGFSRWRFAAVQACFATTLTATDAGWKVLGWGQRLSCPAA